MATVKVSKSLKCADTSFISSFLKLAPGLVQQSIFFPINISKCQSKRRMDTKALILNSITPVLIHFNGTN